MLDTTNLKNKRAEQTKRYREKYRNIIALKKKEYAKKHKEKIIEYKRQYYLKNKEGKIKEYKEKNRDKIALSHTTYLMGKYNTDIQYKLRSLLRGRLWFAIKRNKKAGSAVRDLGCTISELKFYLEGKFTDGMSWDSFGEWHIDHIIPLSFFDLSNREQFIKACHYTNLQPLWAKDNLSKNKKFISNLIKK